MRTPNSKNIPWTADMDEYLIKKRLEGQTFEQIGFILGIRRTSACKRFRQLMPDAPSFYVPRKRVHSPETRDEVVRLRLQGKSHAQIAVKLGLRLWQVCGIWNHWRDYVQPRKQAA